MNELKPCPFCKGEERGDIFLHDSDCYFVLQLLKEKDSSKRKAAWNTRPIEDELNQKIETLTIERDYRPRMDTFEQLQSKFHEMQAEKAGMLGTISGLKYMVSGYKEEADNLRDEAQRMKDALTNIVGMIAGRINNDDDVSGFLYQGDLIGEIHEMAELGLEVTK